MSLRTIAALSSLVAALGCGADAETAGHPDVAAVVDAQADGDAAPGADTVAKGDVMVAPDAAMAETVDDASLPEEDVASEPPTGEALFGELCSGCHGTNGEGTALGYELHHVPSEFARWVIRNGREGTEFVDSAMPAWSVEALSDPGVDAIIEWLNAVPMPTSGEGLYKDFCANCHGQFGLGGVVGHDLLHHIDDGPDLYIQHVRSGHNTTDYGNRTGYMPAWTADELPDAAIEKIVDYLAGK